MKIPEKITAYNVYDDGERLAGVTGDVTLPDFEAMTTTLEGAGILGSIDSPNIGQFGSQKLAIPLLVPTTQAVRLFEPRLQTITLRANQQSTDVAGGKIGNHALKITVRGMPTGFKPGKVKPGEASDAEINLELYYIKITLDGATLVELDKLNFIFVLNGVDYLEEVRRNI